MIIPAILAALVIGIWLVANALVLHRLVSENAALRERAEQAEARVRELLPFVGPTGTLDTTGKTWMLVNGAPIPEVPPWTPLLHERECGR
jgi:hypothetical protein